LNKHIAFIPAREGSVGFKHKNRLFFDNTANFLDSITWFDNVIVSSDDSDVVAQAKNRNYRVHNRSNNLSGSSVSIKSVLENVISEMNLDKNDYIWLFYLTILYKSKNDFDKCKSLLDLQKINSLCSFVPAETNPFNCWKYNKDTNSIEQFISNDFFRRQDLPDAWMLHHYLCCFRVGEITNLNSELVSQDTYPYLIDNNLAQKLIEIDTPDDFKKWKRINSVS
jgi:CMP-N-acetylneuraminic acid synthetase|tara:strand:+ start:1523 stop:2194 length:672 start_codon:yes stop_codon:yes gene_type:complete